MGKWLSRFLQWPFGRFVLVGLLNFAVDYGSLLGLSRVLKWHDGWRNFLVKVMATTIAMGNSYLWNRYWTFEQHTQEVGEVVRIKRFLLVTLTGNYLINSGSYFLAHNDLFLPMGIAQDRSMFLASVVGVAVATLWNFFGYRRFVF